MGQADTEVLPNLEVDLYDTSLLADPWATLRRVREAGPLVWNPQGFWMTAHDRICRQVLSQPAKFGQKGLIASLFGEEAFISIDDRALHNALRDVWVAHFGHKWVEDLSTFVRTTIEELLDRAIENLDRNGEVDLVRALCRPLPAFVIAQMMGVAPDMIPSIISWSDLMAEATSNGFPIDYENDQAWLASEKAKAELAAYIRDQIRLRRDMPAVDLISAMVQSEIAKTLSDEALMVNIRQLLFAGNETTSNWLGHIVAALAERPELRAALIAAPSLVPAAAEEIMRWQGVTQVLPRMVGADGAEIAGVALPAGSEIMLLVGAAGRDPARWDRPDELDIYRDGKPHLAFGLGLHSCLGATLARMEAREVIRALLRRLPEFSLKREVTFGNFSLRGPTSVVVSR